MERLSDSLSQTLAHGDSGAVDTDAVDDGVWSGKVDILEDVWGKEVPVWLDQSPAEDFLASDDDGLAWTDVLEVLTAEGS